MGVRILCCLLLLLLTGCQHTPPAYVSPYDANGTLPSSSAVAAPVGPATAELQKEITAATQATDWPALTPSMEEAITGPRTVAELGRCGHRDAIATNAVCTWGEDTAPTKIVLVGDSVALTYAGPLRQIALDSGGQLQVHSEAMFGCTFTRELIANPEQDYVDACPAQKQRAVDYINTTKPTVVVISSSYGAKKVQGTDRDLTAADWAASTQELINEFRGNTQNVVFLAAPPADIDPGECYAKRDATPTDCLGTVTDLWKGAAAAEQKLAADINGVWVDSRPWFCSGGRYCPAFVDTTPVRIDRTHMTTEYGQKIRPALQETLQEQRVF